MKMTATFCWPTKRMQVNDDCRGDIVDATPTEGIATQLGLSVCAKVFFLGSRWFEETDH